MSRTYDLVVFGATSSVGVEMVRYLSVSSSSLKWAIAGRSSSSLQPLAASAASQSSSSSYSPPIIIADINDEASLRAMARQTRVLLTTVGPYQRYGEGVIRACIAEKTHYCDITGEVEWVDEMKKKYHADAQKAGVYLLSFCGYDSIPSELGVYLAAKELKSNGGPGVVESFHNIQGGGFPTGTVETILLRVSEGFEKLKKKIFGGAKDASDNKNEWKKNPGLIPDSEKAAWRVSKSQALKFWSNQAKMITPPHFMAPINTTIVHSSAAALGYGGLKYNERLVPVGVKAHQSIRTLYGLIPTIISLFVLFSLGAITVLGFLRPFSRFINSKADKKKALTHVTVIGTSKDNKARASVVVAYPGDAGIVYTTLLAVETAKTLADGKGITGPTGFSTPTVTMGDELAKRLSAAGVRIEVKKENL